MRKSKILSLTTIALFLGISFTSVAIGSSDSEDKNYSPYIVHANYGNSYEEYLQNHEDLLKSLNWKDKIVRAHISGGKAEKPLGSEEAWRKAKEEQFELVKQNCKHFGMSCDAYENFENLGHRVGDRPHANQSTSDDDPSKEISLTRGSIIDDESGAAFSDYAREQFEHETEHGITDQNKANHFKLVANVFALGISSDKSCEPIKGKGPKSFNEIQKGALRFGQKEAERASTLQTQIEFLDEQMEELMASEDPSIQLEGLRIQMDMYEKYIDTLVGNGGKIAIRNEFLEFLERYELYGLEEYDNFVSEVDTCEKNVENAFAIAEEGCNRVKLVEVCDGDNCEVVEEADPVEGACEAMAMIPSLNSILAEYDGFYVEVLPSNLHEKGYKNLVKQYKRYASNMIPEGDWSGPINSCGQIVADLYQETGVVCTSLREDGENEFVWEVPQEGDMITDFYRAHLDRTPDQIGYHYWNNMVSEKKAEGATEEEIFEGLKYGFKNSTEYREIQKEKDGEQPRFTSRYGLFSSIRQTIEIVKKAAEDAHSQAYAEEHGLEDRLCSFRGCDMDELLISGAGENSELSDDTLEHLDLMNEASREFIFAVIDTNEDFQALNTMIFDSINSIDLIIGQSHNRTIPVEILTELIHDLNTADVRIVNNLFQEYQSVLKVYTRLLQMGQGTQTDMASNSTEGARTDWNSQGMNNNSMAHNNSQLNAAPGAGRYNAPTMQGSSAALQEATMANNTSGMAMVTSGTNPQMPDKVAMALNSRAGFVGESQQRLERLQSSGQSSALNARQERRKSNLQARASRHIDRVGINSPKSHEEVRSGFIAQTSDINNPNPILTSTPENNSMATRGPASTGSSTAINNNSGTSEAAHFNEGTSETRRTLGHRSGSSSGIRSTGTRRSSGQSEARGSVSEVQIPQTDNRIPVSVNNEIGEIVKHIQRNRLNYVDAAGHDINDINSRDRDLFNVISRRYLVSGMERLHDQRAPSSVGDLEFAD